MRLVWGLAVDCWCLLWCVLQDACPVDSWRFRVVTAIAERVTPNDW